MYMRMYIYICYVYYILHYPDNISIYMDNSQTPENGE